MVIYLKKEDMPKNCGEGPCCYYFEKDAHGKGKHEVCCTRGGTWENLIGNPNFKKCKFIKCVEELMNGEED